MIEKVKNTAEVYALFHELENKIIKACLEGKMGSVYSTPNRLSALSILGDFSYFCGVPDKELVAFKEEEHEGDFMIMVPQDEVWGRLIEAVYGGSAKKITRYAMKGGDFDSLSLALAVAGLPGGYQLRPMTETLFNRVLEEDWSKDLVSQFRDYLHYKEEGRGMVILKDNEIVCGASSYCACRDGIEIEIDTKEAYRRRGLAYACGAGLILDCLAHHISPGWDAHNKGSMALAEKLGYELKKEYTAYEIWGY